MNKAFITTIITLIICINILNAQQYSNLPPIQLTRYNLDSIKATSVDTQSLISQLERIKSYTEEDLEEINRAFQSANAAKAYNQQQKKLLQTKKQIILTQKQQLKQEDNSCYKEKKLIEKAIQQLEKDTQLSDSARISCQESLKKRMAILDNKQINANSSNNQLLAEENELQNEQLNLQQRDIEIQSYQSYLKHLQKTTKIKIKQLTSEIKYQKNKP